MKWLKIKFVLLVIFMLIASSIGEFANSQDKTDSLRQRINTEKDPVSRAELYIRLAGYLIDSAPDSSLRYYDMALKIAETFEHMSIQKDALFSMGNAYKKISKPDTALIFYRKSITLGKMLNDSGLLAKSYLNSAKILDGQNQPDSAIKLCKAGLQYA